MRKVTYGQRLRYGFDNLMSKGAIAMIGMLALLSLLAILIFTLLTLLPVFGPEEDTPNGFVESFWRALLRTLDPGTMGGDQGGWPFLLSMLGVTIVGLFIVSTLIGVLSSGIDAKLDELRKGRSYVIENNHTLILGWSDQVFTILSELAIANANQKNPRVVILADRDKVEMETEIREKVPNLGKMRVICRNGNPIDLDHLEIVNPQGAKSIIVLAPDGDDPDSQVIKTVLAITNNPNRRPVTEPYHIVAEIHSPKNLQAAQLVGGTEAQIIDVGDTISRLVVQTCRQSGLSVVYTELLDFDGDEIYTVEEPALVGKTFGEALLAYRRSALIGVRRAGVVQLNPPMETVIAPGDSMIVVTEDDDTAKISQGVDYQIDEAAIRVGTVSEPKPENILILGWNRRGLPIVSELDHYVMPGSTVAVVADTPDCVEEVSRRAATMTSITVTCAEGDTTDRQVLDNLGVENYDHVIVLCSDDMDPQRADARTLITLLHLRDIEAKLGDRFSIVSEMLDDRNRQLAEVTKADDFIVSDKLISLMLSQISENKDLGAVFADLFNSEGSEIYLKPASDYVNPGQPINFYTVVEAARRRGEVALGYRIMAKSGDASAGYGVTLNPDKAETITFSPADRIVVLAEA
ncbi:MAG: NAD-binding protein [Chloroflexota bacterium]|nr:NAD-binding protein [Chloroflexota bacterium]MDQ5867407.1 NAD-binding protein [Chloroflexota bacterium]